MYEKEFDEMRSQMGILKEKLDNESIVNDKMMRTVLNTKVDNLRKKKWLEWACGMFVIITSPYSFGEAFGSSWQFIVFTDLMMLFCIAGTQYIYGPVTKRDLMSGNLLEVSKRMSRFKKQMKQWMLYIGFPLIAIWYGLLVWEITHSTQFSDNEVTKSLLIGTTVGLVVGGIIGIRMARSAINTAEEIIRQIEE